ncbi:Hypothetical predicted protein [Lecanosticta acicola]|uniref:Uncharacterized protein n=1 Tax=Lecanosticta acicola TaxID=111012 RepID=A0AAI9EC70_9PEZI|nr:Hypothetical predicted protein [Lecanosticta acicola]
MAATAQMENPEDVANRVMRRVQVSKMTRALQDRLALANVKIQNGWENLSMDAIEPQVRDRLRRKRPASSNDTISDTASTTSSRLHSSNGLASSPITEPMFSDDLSRSGRSLRHKRSKPSGVQEINPSGAATGRRTRGAVARQNTWKKNYSLPESSPIKPTKHARFPSNQVSHLSFISEAETIADDPPSPEFSEEDDADLPVTSFSINASTRITSSPPQTPPPDRRMRKTIHQVSWSRTPKHEDDGADLLMYLATSPSPANVRNDAKTVVQPPSTPPCKSTPLPSSHMTPGTTGNGFFGFGGPNTPSTSFNFNDFINVTPSPAQGAWQARTPIAGRTPGASARRRLDFDKLMPPTSTSPTMTRNSRGSGLGMDLGGELVSS